MKERTVLIISMVVINVLIFIGSAQAGPIKVRVGYDMPPFTVPGIGIQAWADEVEAKTEGRIDIEIYPSNSLSDQKSAIDMLRLGVADAYLISLGMNRKLFPTTNVHALPGLSFPDTAKGHKAHADALLALIDKYPAVAKEMKEYVIIFNVINGNFVLISKKPLSGAPSGLKGVKVGGSGVRLALIKKLGGAAVFDVPPISYQKLQTGVIEATTCHYMGIGEFKMYEVANHVLDISWGQSGLPLVMSKKAWNKIPSKDQKIIIEAARIGEKVTYAEAEKRTKIGMKSVTDAGGTISKPSAKEMKLWDKEFAVLWDGWIAERKKAGVKDAANILKDWKLAVDKAWGRK